MSAVHVIEIETSRQTELVDVTERVRAVARGTCVTVFVPHTTAGIVLQAAGEGARHVAADIETAFEELVDEQRPWRHVDEGDRNPWSHVRAALTASSVTIPFVDGELALGEHQSIFLCEFDGPRTRRVLVTVH